MEAGTTATAFGKKTHQNLPVNQEQPRWFLGDSAQQLFSLSARPRSNQLEDRGFTMFGKIKAKSQRTLRWIIISAWLLSGFMSGHIY